jgi:hypothetical protein
MSGPVFYESNQFLWNIIRSPQFFIHYSAEQADKVDVLPLVVPAYIIGFTCLTPVEKSCQWLQHDPLRVSQSRYTFPPFP